VIEGTCPFEKLLFISSEGQEAQKGVKERRSLSYISSPSLYKGGDKGGRLLNKYLRGCG
jgi:hypothetical protein